MIIGKKDAAPVPVELALDHRYQGLVDSITYHDYFLVAAGKELASLLSRDYSQLKAILRGLKNDAV